MLSLPDDSEFNQLLDQLEGIEEESDESDLLKQFFRETILEKVQEKIEQLMKAERDSFLEEEADEDNSGNGYYSRGMTTRGIADILEKMYGTEYSRATVSRITDITLDEVEEWKNREIDSDYYVLYVDAFVVDLKRDSVGKEVIYMVSGVNTDGYREVLYVGGNESASFWKEMLSDLKQRGLERVLLVVGDDLPLSRKCFRKQIHSRVWPTRCETR